MDKMHAPDIYMAALEVAINRSVMGSEVEEEHRLVFTADDMISELDYWVVCRFD